MHCAFTSISRKRRKLVALPTLAALCFGWPGPRRPGLARCKLGSGVSGDSDRLARRNSTCKERMALMIGPRPAQDGPGSRSGLASGWRSSPFMPERAQFIVGCRVRDAVKWAGRGYIDLDRDQLQGSDLGARVLFSNSTWSGPATPVGPALTVAGPVLTQSASRHNFGAVRPGPPDSG
jgi:hypothetical protein